MWNIYRVITISTTKSNVPCKMPNVKESACNAGTLVQSLGGEDPLEKEMATHSSILTWKIQWMEETGRLQTMGSQRVGHD